MSLAKVKGFVVKQLSQCIIQSRINVVKPQILKFHSFISDLIKFRHSPLQSSIILDMIQNLIITPRLQISHQNLQVSSSTSDILITITLKHNSIDKQIWAQIWMIKFQDNSPVLTHETYSTLAIIFQEVLMFLNEQPLFSEYQKNSKIRQQYMMDYTFVMRNKANSLYFNQFINTASIFTINHRYSKFRTCLAFDVHFQCYSMDSFQELEKQKPSQNDYKLMELLKKLQQSPPTPEQSKLRALSSCEIRSSSKRNEEVEEQFNSLYDEESVNVRRKMSLYELYDTSLDITVLSNNDKSFESSPHHTIKEFEIEFTIQEEMQMVLESQQRAMQTSKMEEQQHFEILGISEDQKMFNLQKSLLEELTRVEQQQLRQAEY